MIICCGFLLYMSGLSLSKKIFIYIVAKYLNLLESLYDFRKISIRLKVLFDDLLDISDIYTYFTGLFVTVLLL